MKRKIGLFVLIFLISIIGFVIVKNNLKLNISKDSIWDVHFDNLKASVINGYTFVPESPEIESTTIKAYDVLISKSGDYATWTFDVVNNGDIDAKLANLIKVNPKCISLELPANTDDEKKVCNNLEYEIIYSKNNQTVKVSDIIKAHSKENITLKIGYNNPHEMLEGEVQITMFDMNFLYNKN